MTIFQKSLGTWTLSAQKRLSRSLRRPLQHRQPFRTPWLQAAPFEHVALDALPELRGLVEAEALGRAIREVEGVGIGALGLFLARPPGRVVAPGEVAAIELVRPFPLNQCHASERRSVPVLHLSLKNSPSSIKAACPTLLAFLGAPRLYDGKVLNQASQGGVA